MNRKRTAISLMSTNHAKGFFSVCVLLHHINQEITIFDGSILDVGLNQLGYLSVAVFFFLSGYGIAVQAIRREDYVKQMWKTRILSTYTIYLVVAALYFITEHVVGASSSLSTIVRTFFFGGTVIRNGWYMQSQLLLYVMFYLAFRFFTDQNRRIMMLAVQMLGYVILCLIMQLEPMWYQSVFCFLLGVIWYVEQEKIDKYVNWRTLFFTVVAFGVLFILSKTSGFFGRYWVVCKMLSAIMFAASVAIFIGKKKPIVSRPVNVVLSTLGKYSMGIYLCHGIPLMVFRRQIICIEHDLVYVELVVLGTALLAALLHPLFNFIGLFYKNMVSTEKTGQ